MRKRKEGYITIATNKQRYLELALNLALSTKLKDKKRPICLLHDKDIEVPRAYEKYFDYIIEIKGDDLLVGCTNKLLLFKLSPFDRTMYIDSDCLIIKNDISDIWKKVKKYNFAVVGTKLREGKWMLSRNSEGYLKKDIKKILLRLNLDYIVKFNGGAIYFDKSNISKKLFKKARDYFKGHRTALAFEVGGLKNQFNDEPFLGAAMGFYHLEPTTHVFKKLWKNKQWIGVTQDAYDYEIDLFKGICSYRFGNINHKESPTIAHFCQLKARDIYLKETNRLREYFGLPKIYQL